MKWLGGINISYLISLLQFLEINYIGYAVLIFVVTTAVYHYAKNSLFVYYMVFILLIGYGYYLGVYPIWLFLLSLFLIVVFSVLEKTNVGQVRF